MNSDISIYQNVIYAISRDEEYPEAFENIDSLIKDPTANNNSKKPESKALIEMLSKISQVLRDLGTLSTFSQVIVSSFAVIFRAQIAKDFTLKKYTAFLSSLSNSQLLKDMLQIALETDPEKPPEEKGFNLFPDKSLGNRFIVLVLECLVSWGTRHPVTSNKNATGFKKTLDDLCSFNVNLPVKFVYFPPLSQSKIGQQQYQSKPSPQEKGGSSGQSGKTPQNAPLEAILEEGVNQIDLYYKFLDEIQTRNKPDVSIREYHSLFMKELKKLYAKNDQAGHLPDEWVELYFGVQYFYQKQRDAFSQFIEAGHGDYANYILQMQKDSKELRQSVNKHLRSQNPNKKPGDTTYVNPQQGRNLVGSIVKCHFYIHNFMQINRQLIRLRRVILLQLQEWTSPSTVLTLVDPHLGTSKKTAGQLQAVKYSITKIRILRQASVRQQIYSARTVLEQLQRERPHALSTRSPDSSRKRALTPVRSYRSPALSTQQSRMTTSIFNIRPSGPVVRQDYAGTIVSQSLDYPNQLRDLNLEDGMRHWKSSNFKLKSLLFENDVMQIGFKSTPIYNSSGIDAMLKISMFFGNKGQSVINNFELQYQGDQSKTLLLINFHHNIACLLYGDSQRPSSAIEAGHQLKQELLVVPITHPFNIISIRIKYMHGYSVSRLHLYLPNTLLKFATFRKMQPSQFQSNYQHNKQKVYRSTPFLLSRNLPPSSLKKYVPEFIDLTDYQQFLAQKQYFEYKVGCCVSLMNKHDYLIKIRVRPDLTVIVQVCVLMPNPEAVQFGKILLQTLQYMLQRQ